MGVPEGDRSAIGEPENLRPRFAIEWRLDTKKTALSAAVRAAYLSEAAMGGGEK